MLQGNLTVDFTILDLTPFPPNSFSCWGHEWVSKPAFCPGVPPWAQLSRRCLFICPLAGTGGFPGSGSVCQGGFQDHCNSKAFSHHQAQTPGKSFSHGAFASSPPYLSQTAWKLEIQRQFFSVQSILSSSLSSTTDEIWRDLSSHSHQSQPLKRALSIYPMLCLFIHQKKKVFGVQIRFWT